MKKEMTFKYFCLDHNVDASDEIPQREQLLSIINFPQATYCPEIMKEAMAVLEYKKPLSLSDVQQYQLLAEMRYFCTRDVTVRNADGVMHSYSEDMGEVIITDDSSLPEDWGSLQTFDVRREITYHYRKV